MYTILQSLRFSLPEIATTGVVLIVLMFTYASIGVELFAGIRFGVYLNHHANFNTFSRAMLTLFRVVTGENWNGLMHDCTVQEPQCSKALNDCGLLWQTYVFFYSFLFLTALLVINVFVAVAMKNFQEEVQNEDRVTVNPVNNDVISQYIALFLKHSEKNDWRLGPLLPIGALKPFLQELRGPLASPNIESHNHFMRYLCVLRLPQYNSHVHYLDLAVCILRYIYFDGHNPGIPAHNEVNNSITSTIFTLHPWLKQSVCAGMCLADWM
jgi:hypothetical protein